MKIKELKPIILFAITTTITIGCAEQIHQHEFISMSTIVRITIHNSQPPQWEAIENLAKRYSEDYDWRSSKGIIYKLNQEGQIRITKQLRNTLEIALTAASNTNGNFDPTILPLTVLWDFESGGVIPEHQDIIEAISNVDYKRLTLTNQYAKITNAKLDLSAIAKGAVIDHIADWLITRDHKTFIIEAGGDILVSNLKANGHPWKIWIKHPQNKNYPLAISDLGVVNEKQAMATSGSYEQNFKIQNNFFHHIINPKTGYPAENCLSVTVIASSATKADAYATGLCVAGPDQFNTITSKDNITALMIYKDGQEINKIVTSDFPVPLQEIKL